MIAALYQSRHGGTNTFEKGGVAFGWKSIEAMLDREVQRKRCDQLPRVPGLKESYVYRDSWTRLNVKPAKIMQVCVYHENHNMNSFISARTCHFRTTRICFCIASITKSFVSIYTFNSRLS